MLIGVHEKELRYTLSLAEDVVLLLMNSLCNKGYNVTTYYYFASVILDRTLRQREIVMVGSEHTNRSRMIF